jgi:hypothetical protein
MTQPQPVESVFSRAWELLTRNWIIIVPGIVIGLVVGIVSGLLAYPAHTAYNVDGTPNVGYAFARVVSGLIVGVIAIVGYIATQAYTVGMAGAAWLRGTATLADGAASFREDAGRIVLTAIGLIVLGIVAVLLSVFTLGIAFLAFVLFTLYAMPSAIVGNRPGFTSIGESFRIASQRFVPTLIIAIVIAVIYVLVGLIAVPLAFVPLLGPVVQAIVMQVVVAYATLVIVGEYLNLRAAGAIAPPVPPSEPVL